jgi:Protease inhibitor Inh
MQVPQSCFLPLQPGMTERIPRVSVRADATGFGFLMLARIRFAVIALMASGLCGGAAHAQAPEPSEAAKDMVGAWEISNAARDKTCPLNFLLDAITGGFKLELDEACGTAFPSLKDVTMWAMGPNDAVRLFNSKGAIVLDFTEVESNMYEAERKGEGLFFMRTQAAIKAATVSPEQVFGEWTLLREFEKPLCKLTLSNAPAGGESYKITVKPGCDASVAGLGLSTWRLDPDGLMLSGSGGTWRFSESDPTTWERIPASTDPVVLMRQ